MAVTAPSVPATGVAVPNNTGQNVDVTVTGGTVQGVIVGYAAGQAPGIVTPAVPATTVAVTNTNPFPVAVAVTGGTVTVVAVNGATQFTATGVTAIVPAGQTIALTYSVAPTWTWTPVVAGVTGSPIASPSSFPLPPGCSITPIFTGAPTWAWSNPIDAAYTPGFYGSNAQSQSGSSGYSPYTALSYPPHAAAAQTGLATGVSN